ncbi:MAG: Ribosomal RNA small subunit methyltransferase E [candidate division TM6 bacterium GW2011_GWF2_28_16]|nr:MAG: Ribosomal RNA small subunit methyltransferase E [candidate division TM6 bacterium GW2011_GWF2_28_16]
MSKHVFSLYIENLQDLLNKFSSDYIHNSILEIKDKSLHTRIIQVLRLDKADNKVIFFDNNINVLVELLDETFKNNKNILFKILEKNNNKLIKPEIILCPSIVKKQALEEILYSAAAMGATEVMPIITQKAYNKFNFEQENSRLNKIMIAACEQSKNYILPVLHEPEILEKFSNKINNLNNINKIYFDFDGQIATDIISKINNKNKNYLFFGPESGFTDQEISLLKENNCESISLTPTILRAEHAVAVGLGLVRSLLK